MEPRCSICGKRYPRRRHETYIIVTAALPQTVTMIILEYDIPTEDFYEFGGVRFGSRQNAILYCEDLLEGPSRQFNPSTEEFKILRDIFQRFHAYPIIDPLRIGVKQPPLPSDLKVFYYVPKKSAWELLRNYVFKIVELEWERLVNYRDCLEAKHFPSLI